MIAICVKWLIALRALSVVSCQVIRVFLFRPTVFAGASRAVN
jgi:hypothetical protein